MFSDSGVFVGGISNAGMRDSFRMVQLSGSQEKSRGISGSAVRPG